MALLAQNDWHPPRDSDSMDGPGNRSQHPSAPRQSSPDGVQNTHTQGQAQFVPQAAMAQQQQPYTSQSQPWQPSPQAAPFFPAYQPFFPTPGPLPHPGTSPYFDPNLAHWAYQQMLFNAQAQAQFHAQQQHQAQQQMLQQAEFPRTQSGTPPQQHQSSDYFSQPRSDGFHPYSAPPRRPGRQASASSSTSATQVGNDFPPHPPYARADAAGSSSSVNSGSSGGSRTRKGSNPSAASQQTHGRTISSTSRSSNGDRPPSIKSAPSTKSAIPALIAAPARPSKPSPLGLSQSYSAVVTNGTSSQSASRPNSSSTARPSSPTTPRAEPASLPSPKPTHNKRLSISKDDSQLGDPIPVPSASMVRSGGLKGRLRRALSFNASSTLDDTQEGDDGKLNSRRKALANASKNNAAASSSDQTDDTSPPGSPTTPTGPPPPPPADTKGKSRIKRSLFNPKINASTDNISLSSTVSSASVMIRKLGSMGRLARKNSIMTITSLFGKDKDKRASPAEASVSHATAEVDRGSDNDLMSGLTPAARLARQHTLRSNEEAARRKAEEEAKAKEQVAHEAEQQHSTVPVWERGTTNKRGERIGDVIQEDDEDGSGSGSDDSDGTYDPHHWADDDQDLTIRVAQHPQVYHPESSTLPQGDESWARGIRRSEERTKRPTKGILKNAGSYDQEAVLAQNSVQPITRVRSNSYNHNSVHAEPGPLARIPSPDPDHIDGLHQHKDYLPPFTFEDAPQHRSSSPQPEKDKSSFFNLANMNSSAPALSTIGMQSNSPPTLTHRSATAPVKRLTFAANLSIYDTFSSTVYDRRSEPATCNRLTPALAQRIKEELNSYKMEEMEVHAASRIHTQFFV